MTVLFEKATSDRWRCQEMYACPRLDTSTPAYELTRILDFRKALLRHGGTQTTVFVPPA
ncbi:MAG: hypothetical protein Q4G46_03605 [Propionibacteriaceae bacterium]|nr:hypothetical protein [Propionibacteriaceae bacterium]